MKGIISKLLIVALAVGALVALGGSPASADPAYLCKYGNPGYESHYWSTKANVHAGNTPAAVITDYLLLNIGWNDDCYEVYYITSAAFEAHASSHTPCGFTVYPNIVNHGSYATVNFTYWWKAPGQNCYDASNARVSAGYRWDAADNVTWAYQWWYGTLYSGFNSGGGGI